MPLALTSDLSGMEESRMASLREFDERALRELLQRTGSSGVLSVYVNADPFDHPNNEGVAIDLSNRFRELRRTVEERDRADMRQVSDALERLWPQVETLAGPTEPGRGRIFFAALGDDWALRLDSQMPVASRVVLDDSPLIHPLLELLDEGRAAGVLLVSADEARLSEWRLGELQLLSEMQDEYVEAPHERSGEIGGGPTGQFHTPMREQRQARDRQHAQRFLDGAVEAMAELAIKRGWESILVSGGDRWTNTATSRFPGSFKQKILQEPRVLLGLEEAALIATVTERLHDEHRERERALVERVREAGKTGDAALGLSEVTAALNAGRASHLIYDPDVRYTGSIGTDGTLLAAEKSGAEISEPRQESQLIERLVERALQSGARISPVEGAAAGGLSEAAGIGALLRW